jgi:formiminotetrahydrofolate cyclodeaminase
MCLQELETEKMKIQIEIKTAEVLLNMNTIKDSEFIKGIKNDYRKRLELLRVSMCDIESQIRKLKIDSIIE